MKQAGFDRLRPRTSVPTSASSATTQQDAEGKRALFSREPTLPATGLVVACSRCKERSVVSATAAARTLLPSLHLPVLRRRHPSYVRCPSCGKYSWARLSVKI